MTNQPSPDIETTGGAIEVEALLEEAVRAGTRATRARARRILARRRTG